MFLDRFKIEDMFGKYSYDIGFNEERFLARICTITGPATYGKSFIL